MVTDIGNHSIILGQPWMFKHRVRIDYEHERLRFDAARCRSRCLVSKCPQDTQPSAAQPTTESCPPSSHRHQAKADSTVEHRLQPSPSSSRSLKPVLSTKHYYSQLTPKRKRQLQAPDSDLPLIAEPLSLSEPDDDLTLASNAGLSICCIRAAPLLNLAKKRTHEIFTVSIADINKALAPKVHTDLATKVPAEYHDLLDVFSKENSD